MPSKIYPNLGFWFENIPSGNPGPDGGCLLQLIQLGELFFLSESRQRFFFHRIIDSVKENRRKKINVLLKRYWNGINTCVPESSGKAGY
jgi:hypothetical protein